MKTIYLFLWLAVGLIGFFGLTPQPVLAQHGDFPLQTDIVKNYAREVYGNGAVNPAEAAIVQTVYDLKESKQYADAIDQSRAFLSQTPDAFILQLLLAETYAEFDNKYRGYAYLENLVSDNPQEPMYLIVLGLFSNRHDLFKNAADLFAQAISIDPSNPANAVAYYNLFRFHRYEGRTYLALASLEKASAIQPNNALYLFELGRFLLADGKMEAGKNALIRSTEADPENIHQISVTADILGRLNDTQSVVDFLRKQVKQFPLNDYLVRKYVAYLLYQKKSDEAMRFVTENLQSSPDKPLYWFAGGLVENENDLLKAASAPEAPFTSKAEEYFQKSLHLDPNYMPAKQQLYRIYWRQNNFQKAQVILEQMVAEKTNDLLAYIYLAQLLNAENRIFSAEDTILSGLELDRSNEYLLFEYSQTLYKKKRFKEATSILKGLNEVYPQKNHYAGELGIMFLRTNEPAVAEKYLTLAAQSGNERYIYFLIDALFQEKKLKELSVIAQNERLSPSILSYANFRAAILLNQRMQYQTALGSISRALRYNAEEPFYHHVEANIFGNLGEYAYGLAAIQKPLENGTGGERYRLTEIRLLIGSGNDEQAAAKIQEYKNLFLPRLFVILAADYLGPKTFFTSPFYQDKRFQSSFAAVIRSGSFQEVFEAVKNAPPDYQPFLKILAESKFEDILSRQEPLYKEIESKPDTLDPTYRENAYVSLFETFFSDAKPQEFVDQATAFETKYGSDFYISGLLADKLIALGELDRAAGILETILDRQNENYWAKIKLSYVYGEQKKYRDALAIYNRLLKTRPSDPTILNNMAWIYTITEDKSLQNLVLAEEYIDKSLAVSPLAEYLDTKAELLFQKGALEDALILIEQALAKDNSDADHFKKQRKKILKAITAKEEAQKQL